jgi:endoglucanase
MKSSGIIIALLMMIGIVWSSSKAQHPVAPRTNEGYRSIVDLLGHIHVQGNKLVDQNDNPVALRGMSLFWSQWGGQFYNENCIRWLRDDWHCTVVRAVYGIQSDGYLGNHEAERAKIMTVIDACITLGIYVIVDWHDHHAESRINESKEFFRIIAQKYGSVPNVIYEIYNEPTNISWSKVIKPYAEEVMKVIRSYDPHNLIIVGTPNWSQDVDIAAELPIRDVNSAYAFHFYSSDRWHMQNFRNKVTTALQKGAPIVVTEYGISEANGDGPIDSVETSHWFLFLDQNNLSTCTWSVMSKNETSAALKEGADPHGSWKDSDLSASGKIIRNRIRSLNSPLFEKIRRHTHE